MKLSKCDCGYGSGWYHNESGTRHEFNPNVTAEQATAERWAIRQTPGAFYEHVSGYIMAIIDTYDVATDPYGGDICKTIISKKFTVKGHRTEAAAKQAAAEWVMEQVNNDSFLLIPPKEIQMELFA